MQHRAILAMGMLLVLPEVSRGETHAALGSRVELNPPLNSRYPGADGARTLTDGITGNTVFGKEYLGFEGPDVEITVYLPAETRIHTLAADFLQNTAPAIFLPVSVDFAISANGVNFRTVATVRPDTPEDTPGPVVERIQVAGLDAPALAVRVRAANGGQVPPWHRAPRALRWTFVSEVLVNPGEAPRSALDLLPAYGFGDSRWPLTAIESRLRSAGRDERGRLCDRLAELLFSPEASRDAKVFCLAQLGLFGTEAHVPAVAALLADVELAPFACRALSRLGGDSAVQALLDAHNQAPPGRKPPILGALGELRAAAAVEAIAGDLSNDTLREAAGRALARVATPGAAEILAAAFADGDPDERSGLGQALLVCADRLLEAGHTTAAGKAFATVRDLAPGPLQQLSAAAGQVRAGDTGQLLPILMRGEGVEPAVQAAALALGATLVEKYGLDPVREGFDRLPLRARLAVVRSVGARKRLEEAPWLAARLAAVEPDLQAAAARAMEPGAGAGVIAPLAALLASPVESVRKETEQALNRMAGEGVEQALLEVYATAPPGTRAALARVAASRRMVAAVPLLMRWGSGDDAAVHRAAWKALGGLVRDTDLPALLECIAGLPAGVVPDTARALSAAARASAAPQTVADQLGAALADAPADAHRGVLIEALARLRTPPALEVIVRALPGASPELTAAAIRGLGDWPDCTPAELLLQVGEDAAEERISILALRTALALIGNHADQLPPEQTALLLKRARAGARRPQEIKLLLETAGRCSGETALELVLSELGEVAFRDVAIPAFLRLAEAAWPDAPLRVHAALTELERGAGNEEQRKRAAELLARMPPLPALRKLDGSPWQDLFNGTDLSGWRMVGGKKDSWVVRDGLLVATPGGGGWLARTQPYADYLVEFDFKLPPGGNSGFFLRPPLEGNPAWEGMEVQLLDDAAPVYAGLRPDQYCASIYGIAPAIPRVSRPAGLWQRLRVLCAGRRVSVWLNGRHVAYARLDEHMDKAGKIKGLRRTSGYPGLQNEHGPIEFRNLRIKDLGTE